MSIFSFKDQTCVDHSKSWILSLEADKDAMNVVNQHDMHVLGYAIPVSSAYCLLNIANCQKMLPLQAAHLVRTRVQSIGWSAQTLSMNHQWKEENPHRHRGNPIFNGQNHWLHLNLVKSFAIWFTFGSPCPTVAPVFNIAIPIVPTLWDIFLNDLCLCESTRWTLV